MNNILLFGIPHHDNLGDSAIAIAEKEIIKKIFPNYKYRYILESGQLHPKTVNEMIDFNTTNVICLGLGELSIEDMVNQCIKYDTKDSWTYNLPKDYLKKHAEDWYSKNQMLKVECPKYGIKYIDTSKNREIIFNELIDNLVEKN